jgi:hypothetical protein
VALELEEDPAHVGLMYSLWTNVASTLPVVIAVLLYIFQGNADHKHELELMAMAVVP